MCVCVHVVYECIKMIVCMLHPYVCLHLCSYVCVHVCVKYVQRQKLEIFRY